MTEILLTGPLSLNLINKQVRAAVIGLIALILILKPFRSLQILS